MTSYTDSLPPLRCKEGGGPHVRIVSVTPWRTEEGRGDDCWCVRPARLTREHPVTRALAGGVKTVDGYRVIDRAVSLGIGRGDEEATIRAAVHDDAVRDMRWTARGWHREDLERLHAATCDDEGCPARAPGHSATVSVYGERPYLGGGKT